MVETSHTLERVSQFVDALLPMRERLLANLVMLGQIPGPTGGEAQRVRFMLDRLVESGLPEVGADEAGNAVGLLLGSRGNRTIALSAHLDTIYPANADYNFTVDSARVYGAGAADNSLGASVVSMLPSVLAELDIQLESNLLLLGTIGSLGRGNHEGIRFHLDHATQPIDFGIVVEGVQLGRINYFSIGTLRGDITCDVREMPLHEPGAENALVAMNHIINRILSIAVPKRPYTLIRLGKLHAGVGYNTDADHAVLGLEVVSHSGEMVEEIRHQIEDIVEEMSARHSVDVNVDFFFSRDAGGIPFAHPLVKSVIAVMQQLGVDVAQGPSPSELSEYIGRSIPAVTLGITYGGQPTNRPEYIEIEPILIGVAQLLGVILAIDQGACDEQ